jgi:hypothetical protein
MSDMYFEQKHELLQDDYGSSGVGKRPYSCSRIATDLAHLLAIEGKHPRILTIRGDIIDEDYNRANMVPLQYEGRVIWGAHVICVADDIVYDPMLETPLSLEQYLAAAFGQPVKLTDMHHTPKQPE